jgi:tetratricopeptide (TPR) repeat protein
LSRNKSRFLILALLLATVFGFHGPSEALEGPVSWFDHEFVRARVVVQRTGDGETTLLMDGVLRFAYPDGFQVEYLSHQAPVSITSKAGFVQVQVGSDVQYGYDVFWLFDDVQNYFFALSAFSDIPLEFSGIEQVAERRMRRYIAREDSEFVVWFDEQSGIPFLVRQDQQTFVTIVSYVLENHQLNAVELELSFGPKPARLALELGEEGWVPTRLEMEDPQGTTSMELSNWSVFDAWEDNPLPRLARLDELNDLFFAEFNAKHYEESLVISGEMLALAPQFWQVYLYQAFAYEGIDNYLGVVENYQQVLMRQPDNHLALNNLAYHYFLREVQIPHALEMAKRAVELERKDIYLDTLGYGYYLVGRHEEAKELLLEALETAAGGEAVEVQEHLNLVLKALGEDRP